MMIAWQRVKELLKIFSVLPSPVARQPPFTPFFLHSSHFCYTSHFHEENIYKYLLRTNLVHNRQ